MICHKIKYRLNINAEIVKCHISQMICDGHHVIIMSPSPNLPCHLTY